MSYQVNTKATNVVVGDQVNKDHKWHAVTGVVANPVTPGMTDLVFGNASTIPLHQDDYVTVRRSSKATTPLTTPREDVVAVADMTDDDEDDGFLDLDGDDDEDDGPCCNEDYGPHGNGHAPWCSNK